jgi:thiol-disulfide isomerase/thioredoxin
MPLRVAVLLVATLLLTPQAAQKLGTDLSGHPVEQLAPAGSKAVVLFFAASDCPISNRYIPEIDRLAREFASLGVTIWWVYPNPSDTAEVVRQHQLQFNFHGQIVLDTEQQITQMAHATMTPEVAIFVPDSSQLREVYLGRIDDRYIALGQERPAATRHDLADAIHAVLTHQPVLKPGGPTVGCAIVPLSAR